jgi:hypothetical protein
MLQRDRCRDLSKLMNGYTYLWNAPASSCIIKDGLQKRTLSVTPDWQEHKATLWFQKGYLMPKLSTVTVWCVELCNSVPTKKKYRHNLKTQTPQGKLGSVWINITAYRDPIRTDFPGTVPVLRILEISVWCLYKFGSGRQMFQLFPSHKCISDRAY